MKNPFKVLTAGLALALAAGSVAFAADSGDSANPPPPPPPDHERGPGGPGGGGRGGPSLEVLTEKLGLTADQQAKIGPLIKKRMEEGKALRNDETLTREQKMEKGRALREEGAKEIEALLTPDQVKKFQAMREEMRNRGPRNGNRPPPPPPPTEEKPST